MTSYISALSPSGNNHRINLLGTDLIFGGINNVFVYPNLDVDRLKHALSQTLSHWPILTGRIFVENDDQYFIECSDQSIPFTFIENNQLEYWPDLPVVIDDGKILEPFIDSIQYKPEIEPLLRLKLTHLIHSNEYIFGTSFSHTVGDADSNLHFLNDLSQIYQYLQPILPHPIFERILFEKEEPDFTFPIIKELSEQAEKREIILERITKEQTETEPINITFSFQQLKQLHNLIKNIDPQLTIHDTLCAYIIILINKYLFTTTDEFIENVRMVVNYRGSTSNSLIPKGHVANSFLLILSSNFPDDLSLSSIAKTIRQTIDQVRHDDFLKKYIIAGDILKKQLHKEGRLTFLWNKNDLVINSNYKYDWTNQVNFGMINQCRFHTMGTFKFYCRIFQTNPIKNSDGTWTKDNGGAEISFRIPKGEGKEKILKAYVKDIEEHFSNFK